VGELARDEVEEENRICRRPDGKDQEPAAKMVSEAVGTGAAEWLGGNGGTCSTA